MSKLRQFLQSAWCRIAYGHLMIPYGTERYRSGVRQYTMYMCARCLLTQRVHFIGRDKEAE